MRIPSLAVKWGVLALGAAVVLVAAIRLLPIGKLGVDEVRVPSLAKDEIVVLRTPGGKLQVATLIKNEEFSWKTTYTCPILNCEKLLGQTVSKVTLPVHYTYVIPLAAEWKIKFRETHFELKVPRVQPNLPPGADTKAMQLETRKGRLSPSSAKNIESLMKQLGPDLEQRAGRVDYIAAQREEARKTVGEFARKWMIEQRAGKDKSDYPIKIFFEDEVS